MSDAGRVFPTIREAIHATATSGRMPLKALAGELDWSPTELSMRTTLSGDSARPFPADDDHLVKLMRVTSDHSILHTLADLMGYELHPKKERIGQLIVELTTEAKNLQKRLQLVLDLGIDPALQQQPQQRRGRA